MKDEKDDGGDLELPFNRLFDLSSGPLRHSDWRKDEGQRHLLTHSTVKRHHDVAEIPTIKDLGIEPPRIFFEPDSPALSIAATDAIGVAWDKENYRDGFHDSESEDIYDLYNACNGVVCDGLLDVRALDELSPEELEVLNVRRLKEIWLHTVSGCQTCAGIINTLNAVRGMLGEDEEEPRQAHTHLACDKPH
jgi:hypothetical protein